MIALPKTPETIVRDPVKNWAKRLGLIHFRMSQARGVSTGRPDDWFGSAHGTSCFVEFKAPGESPKPKQLWVMSELSKAQHNVFWADDPDRAIILLQRVLFQGAEARGQRA